MTPRFRVGIDVGGTFTDVFLFDETSGAVRTHKVSSTPADPHRAPIRGLTELLARVGRPEDVVFAGLGTTVATNALLEGKGARTGLITTRGFRDLLEIGRQTRPDLYDPFVQKPKLLIPRQLRCEVSERIAADGSVVVSLVEKEVNEAIRFLQEQGVASIAVCFLNAYVNPVHEARVVELIRKRWPSVAAVASSEVIAEYREYERFVSTVVNAYLIPPMRNYFAAFEREVHDLGVEVAPVVMSSSGGALTPKLAGSRPIDTLFSGPSGGVSGAVFVSSRAGISDIITFDMGGTSTEVCLVRDARPELTFARVIKGYPIRTTSHDIHTIGAGGSSIALLEVGGMLRVGPESAGADPGPACYPSGGKHATVTDANVVLGRLNQRHLLGGSLKIDAAKSRAVIERALAAVRQITPGAAAATIVALAEANMAQALRAVSVERGIDPKDFTLVALGGAGPLHAATVAREVGVAAVLVPLHPGVLCAMGVLTKDLELNFSRTKLIDASSPTAPEDVARAYEELETRAAVAFEDQSSAVPLSYERTAAVRYVGQNHELSVVVPGGSLDDIGVQQVKAAFHAAHAELYGYCFEDSPVELVTLRLAAQLRVDRPEIQQLDAREGQGLDARVGEREVSFDGDHYIHCPIYDREHLSIGQTIQGPAVVEQMDATTVIPPGFLAQVDSWLNLKITWS